LNIVEFSLAVFIELLLDGRVSEANTLSLKADRGKAPEPYRTTFTV